MTDDRLDSRRAALVPEAAPTARLEYTVRMEADLGEGRLSLAFVPDRMTLGAGALDSYLAQLPAAATPEATALIVLEDLVNELVCRWLRVELRLGGKTVVVEDRQPGWANDALLARLPAG